MTVVWTFPTRILFGTGSARAAGAEARALGAMRALVVTDAGVTAAGRLPPVLESLAASGLEPTVFDGANTNPLEADVAAAVDAFRSANADVIVACGGGSVIDVAKLTRLVVGLGAPLDQIDPETVGSRTPSRHVPLVALPTTAGAGSEVSSSALVTLAATRRKTVFATRSNLPEVAILDAELTATLPPRLTAASGMSALARCIEAYSAPGEHPMADAIALNGIAQSVGAFERAVHDGGDLDARSTMLKSSMMGSVAAQKGLGLCDSLAHAISVESGVHHGLACAIALPHVLDFNRHAAVDKIAKLARVFGARVSDTETLAFECAGAIRSLRKKVGLPDSLRALGIEEHSLRDIATVALADPSTRTNPRVATLDDVVSLLEAAL